MPKFEGKTLGQFNSEASRSEFEKKVLMGALKDEAKKEDVQRNYAEEEVKAMNEMPEKEMILNEIKKRFYDGHEDEALKNFDEKINIGGSSYDYESAFHLGWVDTKDGHFTPAHLGLESIEEMRGVVKCLESGLGIIGAHEDVGGRLAVGAFLNEKEVYLRGKNKKSFDSESLDPVDLDGPEGPERG